jgi:hypothetical protein
MDDLEVIGAVVELWVHRFVEYAGNVKPKKSVNNIEALGLPGGRKGHHRLRGEGWLSGSVSIFRKPIEFGDFPESSWQPIKIECCLDSSFNIDASQMLLPFKK